MQFNFLPLEIVLLVISVISLLIQFWFTLGIHRNLLFFKSSDKLDQDLKPLSVVIAARNEAENLKQFLPKIFEQDYPNFEVVVVNDRSWDGTADLLKEFSLLYPNLKIVTIAEGEKFIAGKKFAVSMGIKAAKNEWLVFTDADCEPSSDQWLKEMSTPNDENVEILLGYSPYFKSFGLLNALIRYETFFTAVNYLSFALKGNPYMGVGRNLAYKKSLFFKGKGFAAHMHISSGDDDLFVNANANSINTGICMDKDAQVWSIPKDSWSAYFKQKKRHGSAGKLYKSKHKWILSLQIVFQVVFYASLLFLAFLPNGLYFAIGIWLFSILVRAFVYPTLLSRLNYPELRWWFPFLDVLLYVFLMFNGVVSIFVKKSSWK